MTNAMKMPKPSTCRARIEAYISVTRRRSTGVMAENDWRIIAASRSLGEVVTADICLLLSRLHHPHGNLDAHQLQVHHRRTKRSRTGRASAERQPGAQGLRWPQQQAAQERVVS